MKKTLRSGVDVEVALTSALKRLAYDDAQSIVPGGALEMTFSNMQAQAGYRQRVKAGIRSVARVGYRLLKPFLRPLAFRVRRYLIEGTNQEIHKLREEIQAINGSSTQTALLLLLKDLKNSNEIFLTRLESVENRSYKLLEEIQAIKDTYTQTALLRLLNDLKSTDEILLTRLESVENYSYETARRVAIPCSDGEVLVRTAVGYVLCSASDHALLACLVDSGDLERGTRLLIQKFLQPGDCFIDVGANIGMHTIAAARAMNGRGSIVAFEPFEATKRMLEKTVWMNGFSAIVEVRQAAVSNVSDRQRLYLGLTSGHHSLFPLGEIAAVDKEAIDVITVRLDSVIQEYQKVDLIKIDVEGAELQVLESAELMIRRNPDLAIIVEFGPSHLKRAGKSPEYWLQCFEKLGLHYRVIDDLSGNLEDWSYEKLLNCISVNLFFSRKSSLAWERLKG